MIKTRFAPSPTGYLHIGGLRTALYAYLWARKNNGKFLLRLEDTDQSRLVDDAADRLLDILSVFGLSPDAGPRNPDEFGPYRQSERLSIYTEKLHALVKNGSAYYCFCSSERLGELRADQEALKLPTGYDGHCRDIPFEESFPRVQAGESYTIRLKVPKWEVIVFEDLIRGKMEFNTNEVEDTVLLKSDGFPTYHGAVVIDDDHMGVTHAMRGEEWISSIPTQVLTARALGVTLPRYAHMPNIMGSDGKKLSKRTGDTATELYLERGYLPEAILNFVAFLGWNPKTTQEIFSLTELEEAFSFEGMNRSGPMLDIVKLDWMNAQYISRLETADLCTRLTIYLETYLPDFYRDTFSRASSELNYRIIHELKTRLKRLDEYPSLTQFFYGEPDLRQDLLINPKMKVESLEDARTGLEFARSFLQNISGEVTDFDAFKAEFLAQIAGAGYKNGFVLWPVRIALSGAEFSPGAFEIVSILGKEVSIQRITRMLEKLED